MKSELGLIEHNLLKNLNKNLWNTSLICLFSFLSNLSDAHLLEKLINRVLFLT